MPTTQKQVYIFAGAFVTAAIAFIAYVADSYQWKGTMETKIEQILYVQNAHTQWIREAPPDEFEALMNEKFNASSAIFKAQTNSINQSLHDLKDTVRELKLELREAKKILNSNSALISEHVNYQRKLQEIER